MADLRSERCAPLARETTLEVVVKSLVRTVMRDPTLAPRMMKHVESAHRRKEISDEHFAQLSAVLMF